MQNLFSRSAAPIQHFHIFYLEEWACPLQDTIYTSVTMGPLEVTSEAEVSEDLSHKEQNHPSSLHQKPLDILLLYQEKKELNAHGRPSETTTRTLL